MTFHACNLLSTPLRIAALAALAAGVCCPPAAHADESQQQRERYFRGELQPFLQTYCADCHSGGDPEGGLSFDRLSDAGAIATTERKTWRKVYERLYAGQMPPEDAEQPPREQREKTAEWIRSTLEDFDCSQARDPGRVTIRRLNRAEYANTVRDLVGVAFNPAEDFPSDDVGYGFDNIGDVLTVSPLLMEKYIDAAERVAAAAIVVHDSENLPRMRFEGDRLKAEGSAQKRGEVYSMPSSGAVFADVAFPYSGAYVLRARASADQAGDERAKMEFRLGDKGRDIKTFLVQGERKLDNYETTVHVSAGTLRFAAAFTNDYYNPKDPNPKNRDRNLQVKYLEVEGPLEIDPKSLPASHQAIVIARPDSKTSLEAAAQRVLLPLASRAFRRPATKEELANLTSLVKLAVERGDTYERGVQVALTAVLVSPHFLFRVERDEKPDDPDAQRLLNEYELAARLSYFLWSSMPDKELFDLAWQRKLRDPAVLRAQVQRMLADEKAEALVDNFAVQWLNLQTLDEIAPDPKIFPAFSDELRGDMRRETEMLFASIVRDDLSALDLLDADFTFVNERLAAHYGIDGVKGEEFRRVSLAGKPRAGLLTQASVLTLTSNPDRTSPVKRGKWILENILGAPPPAPPPDVPELEETAKAAPGASLRKQLEIHRADSRCAVCHETMDELGFGFENFDAIGRWRDKERSQPINAAGKLPGSGAFDGPLQLVQILKMKQADFGRCLTEKLLTYALGRGLEYYDQCAVEKIVAASAADDYRFSSLVTAIVESEPFLMRRGEEPQGDDQ